MKNVLLFIVLVQALYSDFMTDLEEQGYCVIPHVLSPSEAEVLYERVWHEFIEKAWPNCKMDDRRNWKETFPIHNPFAIFCGPAGQIQPMWDVRQDPRIVDIFAEIWNTHELIVSMDGLSLMCPVEIREGYTKPFPHVDQGILFDYASESPLKTAPYTIQGQFLFEDSFEGDGGFYCIPKSHLRFGKFTPKELFAACPSVHVIAPRGSLILWDSRTVHWNQHASKDSLSSNVRMVGYLCYVPKSRLTEEGRKIRQKAFEKGVSTTHDPADPTLKYSEAPHVYKEFMNYLEDPNYTQPKIILTPLGESLLGV